MVVARGLYLAKHLSIYFIKVKNIGLIDQLLVKSDYVGLKYLKQQFGVRNKSRSLDVLSASQRPHQPCIEKVDI